jgi:hypothetical protein
MRSPCSKNSIVRVKAGSPLQQAAGSTIRTVDALMPLGYFFTASRPRNLASVHQLMRKAHQLMRKAIVSWLPVRPFSVGCLVGFDGVYFVCPCFSSDRGSEPLPAPVPPWICDGLRFSAGLGQFGKKNRPPERDKSVKPPPLVLPVGLPPLPTPPLLPVPAPQWPTRGWWIDLRRARCGR